MSEDLRKKWKQTQDESKKIDSCTLHVFRKSDVYGLRRCTKCGVEAPRSMVSWYLRGVYHGRKLPK